jgi:hypothetical protein
MKDIDIMVRIVLIVLCAIESFLAFDFAFLLLNARDNVSNYFGVFLILVGLTAIFAIIRIIYKIAKSYEKETNKN